MKDKVTLKAYRELSVGARQNVEDEDYHFRSSKLKDFCLVDDAGISRYRKIVWWHKEELKRCISQ